MSGPFGIDVATFGDAGIDAALEPLGHPPDWLTAIEDTAGLRADIERGVPEFSDGSLRLVSCKFKRARIEDGTWTTLHRLTLEDGAGEGRREVDVRGTLLLAGADAPPPAGGGPGFGAEGWRGYLPGLRCVLQLEPADGALPAMPLLTDAGRSRVLLEAALRTGAAGLGELRLGECEPTVARYREGRRCTVRYDLGYSTADRQPNWPEGAVAKVYEGDEGRITYAGMRALWDSPLRTSGTVRIAEPLAFLPELNVVVQGLVPGDRSLKEHIKGAFADGLRPGAEMLSGLVRRSGRGLAELHGSGALTGPVLSWEAQLDAVRHAAGELDGVVPELAGAMEPLVAKLEQLADAVPAGPLVPTHRSFRPAQVLIHGDDIAFIDFDGFCQAEAGLDLALFRTTLFDLSLRAMERDGAMDVAERRSCEAELDGLCATFLAGYEEVAPVSRERLVLWDALTSAKDILDCWRKIKFEHLDRRMHFLHRRLGSPPAA